MVFYNVFVAFVGLNNNTIVYAQIFENFWKHYNILLSLLISYHTHVYFVKRLKIFLLYHSGLVRDLSILK